MKGSPADQAGIKAGDIIEYIDNKATRHLALRRQQILNGPAAREVNCASCVRIQARYTVTVKRGSARAAACGSTHGSRRVGVLRINILADGESNEIRAPSP